MELFIAIFNLVLGFSVLIYVLVLLSRFVRAHERMALSIDVIARKLKDDRLPL